MQTKGVVFDIVRFCTNDGPGIRTTVFLKGCPLRCVWCHNPESQAIHHDIFYDEEKCAHCGNCTRQCAHGCHLVEEGCHIFNRENCTFCGDCVKGCFGALRKAGYEITVKKVMDEVMKDTVYYKNSGGGLTLSGGEPTAQFNFAKQLLREAKQNGLHTCVETCGYAAFDKLKEVSGYVDVFLYDYKETNPSLHKQFTGGANRRIIENLLKLDAMGKQIILCCPIIPELNDRTEHFEGIAHMANQLTNIVEVCIKPYHSMGETKYTLLGRNNLMKTMECIGADAVSLWIDEVQKRTNKPVNYDKHL